MTLSTLSEGTRTRALCSAPSNTLSRRTSASFRYAVCAAGCLPFVRFHYVRCRPLSSGSWASFIPDYTTLTRVHPPLAQHGCTLEGSLHLDAGAAKSVLARNSLFPAGITKVEGQFSAQVCENPCTSFPLDQGRCQCHAYWFTRHFDPMPARVYRADACLGSLPFARSPGSTW